jgi:CRP-like cAMP-binding protein
MIDFKYKIFGKETLSLNKESIALLEKVVKVEELPKGHLLLKEGQVCHRLYYLEKGTARTFYYHNGKDITSWIYPEDITFSSWYSFLGRKPSFETIEILEPATVYSITLDELENLYQKSPQIERIGRKMLEQNLSFVDIFYKGYLFMSAKERYNLLLYIFPDITQRVNLGHIASLLGISQETLSRIRAK